MLEKQVSGLDGLRLATELLQRARLADPIAGVFEAADVQWSWRSPRLSDEALKTFWFDGEGPVAGILLTSRSDEHWQCDLVIVPGKIDPSTVWARAMEIIQHQPARVFDVPVSDNDEAFLQYAIRSGLTADEKDFTGWLDISDRPAVMEPAPGFRLVDRTMRPGSPHPLVPRSSKTVEQRLQQCSLYDPCLDLAIEADDGTVAGYSLYWFDPITKIGLIEPVRVEEAFQRQGLAKSMLSHGINRLVEKGAEKIKVSWETEAAGALYRAVGFQQQSTTTWYRASAQD